jgi:hypothetical protein
MQTDKSMKKDVYANVESQYNLVYLLGKFFSKRLNNQNYIIHDLERGLTFLHTNEFVGMSEFN